MGEENGGYLSKFQTSILINLILIFVQFLGTFAKEKWIIKRLASGKGDFDNCKQNCSWVIANWWEWTCLLIWTVELYSGTMNFDSKCSDLFWFLMKYSINRLENSRKIEFLPFWSGLNLGGCILSIWKNLGFY